MCSRVSAPAPRCTTTMREAGDEQQQPARRAIDANAGERERLAAEHIVDDDLQRPRLQELEPGDQKNLRQRPGDPPAMRLQIGQKFRQHRSGPCGAVRRGIGARTAGSCATGSTGISRACLATASMMRCISRPKPTSCQTITAELISPTAPIAAAVSGQPRISANAVSAAQLRSRNRRSGKTASRSAPASSRFAPPWFSRADEDQRAAAQAARDLEIPIAPAGIRHDEIFLRHEEIHQPADQRLFLGSGLAPIGEMEGARRPSRCGRAARSRPGRYGLASASP